MTARSSARTIGPLALVIAVAMLAASACGNASLNLSSLVGESCVSGVPTLFFPNLSASCDSCVASKCTGSKSCLAASCSDYDPCYCACASGDLNCYVACQPKLSSACTACQNDVSTCVATSCASACADAGSGSGSSSGSHSDSGSHTDSGPVPPGVCGTLYKCCHAQTGPYVMLCNQAASSGNQGICQQTLTGLMDAGICH